MTDSHRDDVRHQASELFEPIDAEQAQPTATFGWRGPVWSMRTLAVASVLCVAVSAGGGAAIAAMSRGSDAGMPGPGQPAGQHPGTPQLTPSDQHPPGILRDDDDAQDT